MCARADLMNLYEEVVEEGGGLEAMSGVDTISADEVAASFVLPWHSAEKPEISRR